MGKTYQFRNWCITWNEDGGSIIEETRKEGAEFTYDDLSFTIYVGPREATDSSCKTNHRHILLHCSTHGVSKTKAHEALSYYFTLDLNNVRENVVYIRKLETTLANYLAYTYKSLATNKDSVNDLIVKDTIAKMKSAGRVPSVGQLKRRLIDDNGADAYNKKLKFVSDIYMLETDIANECRGFPKATVCAHNNVSNFIQNVAIYKMNLDRCKITTLHRHFKNCPQLYQEFAYMISLLPLFTHRVSNVSDHLPALYLWGKPGCGKSTFFNNVTAIKKIAGDSQGVGRFKLYNYHTAYLMDDVSNEMFKAGHNSYTIKQLTLGDCVQVKVYSDTQEVRAFFIATSNEKPDYEIETSTNTDEGSTDQEDVEVKRSWQRRFFTIEFTRSCHFNGKSIDYGEIIISYCAAVFFSQMYSAINKAYPNDVYVQKCLKLFDLYYKVALEDYKETITNEMKQLIKDGSESAYEALEEQIDDISDSHLRYVLKGLFNNFVNLKICTPDDIDDNKDKENNDSI